MKLISNYLKSQVRGQYYQHIHLKNDGANQPRWRGHKVVKYPTDMILYAQVIFENRPDFIIETGTYLGGSAVFFGDLLSLTGGTKVITVDIRPVHLQDCRERQPDAHPFVEYVLCSSVWEETVSCIRERIPAEARTMVVLDSSHAFDHVWRELELYAPFVTEGQYLVVEDCWADREEPYQPFFAVEQFLKAHKEFEQIPLEEQFIFAVTRGGWLLRTSLT